MSFIAPVDRWSILLADDRAAARLAGTAPEPVAPIIPPEVEIPCEVHFTAPSQLLGSLFDYGDELAITAEMLPALADRNGHVSVLELLHDEAGQRRRFGGYRIRPGSWPAGVDKVAPGSSAWMTARADHYRHARGLAFQTERDAALEEARKVFGPSEFGPCPPSILRTAYGYEPEQ